MSVREQVLDCEAELQSVDVGLLRHRIGTGLGAIQTAWMLARLKEGLDSEAVEFFEDGISRIKFALAALDNDKATPDATEDLQ